MQAVLELLQAERTEGTSRQTEKAAIENDASMPKQKWQD
jgi:hypothetical protein